MSPIQVATPLFITDCNVAWKVKIEKTRFQEGSYNKRVIYFTYKCAELGSYKN